MKYIKLICTCILFLTSSCGPIISEWHRQESYTRYCNRVKVANSLEELSSCKLVDSVQAESLLLDEGENGKTMGLEDLRTEAGRIGANMVVQTGTSVSKFMRIPIIEGKAFICDKEIYSKHGYGVNAELKK